MVKLTLHEVVRDESIALVQMQRRLFNAGLLETAAAINEAANKLGWEVDRLLTQAANRIPPR